MTSLRTCRPGATGAQRRPGAVAAGVHRVMRLCGGARARARPPAAPVDGGEHRADRIGRPTDPVLHIPPDCVTRATPCHGIGIGARHIRRPALFRPGFLRPLGLQRKVRYDGIHRQIFRWYSATAAWATLHGVADSRGRGIERSAPAVRGRYVDDRWAIGTGPMRWSGAAGAGIDSQGSFRFLRTLPGTYLQVCECRHSN